MHTHVPPFFTVTHTFPISTHPYSYTSFLHSVLVALLSRIHRLYQCGVCRECACVQCKQRDGMVQAHHRIISDLNFIEIFSSLQPGPGMA